MLFNIEKRFKKEIELMPQILESTNQTMPVDRLQEVKQKVMARVIREAAVAASGRALKQQGIWRYVDEKTEKVVRYVLSTLVGLSLIGGSAFAANQAMPGDPMYKVKRLKENAELALTFTQESKANALSRFAYTRLAELELTSDTSQLSNDASQAVSKALSALNQVKSELEAKGNTSSAAAVQANIERLQTTASLQNISP